MALALGHVRGTFPTPGIRARRPVVARAESPQQPQPGERILPLLRTPGDVLALGPRVALGALRAGPELFAQVSLDLQRLSSIVRDPRPLEEKQAELLEVVEARVAQCVEQGTSLEEVLRAGVVAVLPQQLKDAIPEPLRGTLLGPCQVQGSGDASALTGDAAPGTGADASAACSAGTVETGPCAPLASRRPSRKRHSFANDLLRHNHTGPARGPGVGVPSLEDSDEAEGGDGGVPETPPPEPVPAELEEVRLAVEPLSSALVELKTGAEPSREVLARINLREAGETMRRRLEQLQALAARAATRADAETEADSDAIPTAIAEACALLEEAEALLAR